MNDDAQILIARLLTHQTLRRDDKMVKRCRTTSSAPKSTSACSNRA
jgi:hypothetical protein